MLCCNSIFYFINYHGLYSCVAAKKKTADSSRTSSLPVYFHFIPKLLVILTMNMKISFFSYFDIAKVSKISELCKLFSIILHFFNII